MSSPRSSLNKKRTGLRSHGAVIAARASTKVACVREKNDVKGRRDRRLTRTQPHLASSLNVHKGRTNALVRRAIADEALQIKGDSNRQESQSGVSMPVAAAAIVMAIPAAPSRTPGSSAQCGFGPFR